MAETQQHFYEGHILISGRRAGHVIIVSALVEALGEVIVLLGSTLFSHSTYPPQELSVDGYRQVSGETQLTEC